MSGMNRLRTILVLAGVLLVAAAIAGIAQPQFGRSATPTGTEITVTGVGAGANNVDGPNLDTADKSSLYGEALKKAIADAKVKAQAIADGAGLTLGALVKVQEGGNSAPPVPMFAAEKAAATVPIEAGTQQIQASVTVTYSAS